MPMKKKLRSLFAILMAFAIAITALPTMEVKAAEGYTVVSASLPVNTITLDNENPNISLEGAEFEITGIDQTVSYLTAVYLCESTDDYVEVELYESDVANIYTGKVYCDADVESGTYVLDYVLIFFENNSSARIYENIPSSSVTVVNNITDYTAPEMIGFTFEQDGQTFTQGTDSVIEFTAEDIFDNEGGSGIYFNVHDGDAVIHLYSNGSIHPCWVRFVKEDDGTYKASVDVDGLANSEWYIYYVMIEDKVGNITMYRFYEEGIYYNFFVKDSEGVCNSSRDITVNFYDEEDELIETKEVTATTGEVVLANLLNEIPTYETDMGFVGWKCEETGQFLEEDTVFIAASTENEYSFYPVTSKRYVEVDTRILDENGEYHWTGYEPYLIESDTTYQELIKLLPTPESVNGANFVEWDLGGYELTDIVEEESVDLWAVYDKQLIEVYCYYMDEDGKFAYETITLPFSADEVVTYEKVLALVPKFETYEGVSFLKWEISDGTTDLTQELEYNWVELNAIYDKYPVTIERKYVDTTGAVKNEKVTKLYPAGTTMESIYNEYAVTPSDASTSLSIEEWQVDEGYPEAISEHNNVLVLTALYDEKTIVEVCYDYIAPMDDHGVEKYVYSYELVSKDIASDADKLLEYCKNTVEDKFTFEHYNGFKFLGWNYENSQYEDTNDDGIIDTINIMAKINNDEVISLVALIGMDMMTGEPEDTYYYVVEAGDTLVLPDQYNGYYLEWYDMMEGEEIKDGKYTIPSDAVAGRYIIFIAEKGEKVPEQVTPPSDTNNNPGNNVPGNNVPNTADTTTVIPYVTLLLLGAGVILVGNKKRNYIS